MNELTPDPVIAYTVALLSHYKFELRGYTAQELVSLWLRNYSANWVRLGVIEALYQGRYKAVSVEQILAVWGRRGQPIFRFTHEFERLISRKLPQRLTAKIGATSTDFFKELSLPFLTSSPAETIDNSIIEAEEPAAILNEEMSASISILKEDLTDGIIQDDSSSNSMNNTGVNVGYDADWSRCEISKQPIHQFTPPKDDSSFYLKLKSVAQQQDLPTADQIIAPVLEEESQPYPSLKI